MSSDSSIRQDQRMLVLLFAALCIATIHLFQFPRKSISQGTKPQEMPSVVWLSGLASSGFYLLHESGLGQKDLQQAFKSPNLIKFGLTELSFVNTKKNSYMVMANGSIKAGPLPVEATPFFYLPLSINKAGPDLLTTLPGIGPKLAQSIIEHRKRIGDFKAVEDICEVEGVGEKKFQKIRKLISL